MGGRRVSFAPLVGLQVRRLCLGAPGLLFLLGLVYLRWSWGRGAGYGGLQDTPLLRSAWALQQGAWLWVLLAGLALGLRLGRLSRKEANWLAPLGVGPGLYLFTLWLGTCMATAIAMVLMVVGLIGTDRITAPEHAIDRVLSWNGDAAIPPGSALNYEFEPGDSQRFSILVRPTVGASPTTEARIVLARGAEYSQSQERILGLTWLSAPIPAGTEAVRLTLANEEDGYLGVIGSRSLLTLSEQGGAAHWFGLALRAWLWAAALLAFVITACTWLRPTLGIPLALLCAGAAANLPSGWLAAWSEVLAWQRAGMGGEALLPAQGLWLLSGLAICWLVARRGLYSWGIDR